ncbi:MAG: dynamin family protein [Acidimicrobiia bacterium]
MATRRFVSAGIDTCTALHRSDLARRLRHALARLDEPSTVLYVAGEYKQGKSMLVNALVGSEVCPVDDDLSTTTVTWLHHHEPATARIRRRTDGESVVDEIDFDEIRHYASEQGNRENRLGIDLVDVGLPSPVLAAGLTVVDSPGVGALRAGSGEAALSFLPYADALILVSDASAELSVQEVAFLRRALEICPHVLVVLTKTDLYREWPRIAELDRAHLSSLGLAEAVHPVSSVLRFDAVRRSDASLNEESGFPDLLAAIRTGVLDDARNQAASRALSETAESYGHLLAAFRAEREALANPESAEQLLNELNEAKHRLASLRRSGARWTMILGDGITDLNQEIDRHLKTSTRDLLEHSDARLGAVDPAAEWDAACEDLQISVAELGRDVFDSVRTGTETLIDRVTTELSETGLVAPAIETADGTDLGSLWGSSDRSLTAEKAKPLGTGLGALRGTSSGVVLMGVMANLAGVAIATPVAISVGLLFGAKHVIDERKRNVERRRQQARTIVRDYLSHAQTELAVESRRAVQEVHRLLRDSFSEQISGLNGALADSIRTIEATLAASERERVQRAAVVSGQIERIEQLLQATEAQRSQMREDLS